MFLKLEVSAVLAASPMRRCRGVNETKDGVAKLETSLAMTSIPLRRATPILESEVVGTGSHIGNKEDSLGCKVSQINTDNSHLDYCFY